MTLLSGCLGCWAYLPHWAARIPVVILFVLAVGAGTVVLAQAQDQSTGQGQSTDSTQTGRGQPARPSDHDSFLDRLALNPIYTSNVNVNRTQNEWDEGFTLHKEIASLKADNSWNMTMQRNSAQNNYRTRQGTAKAKFEYELPVFGGWSAGSELDFKRNFAASNFDRTVSDGTTANLFVSSEALGRMLNRPLGLSKDQLSWTTTGSDGLTNTTDIRQRFNTDNTTGLLAKTNDDSTTTYGSSPALDTDLKYSPNQKWKLEATSHYNWTTESSRTASFQQEGAQAIAVQKATNHDAGKKYTFSSAWAPDPDNHATLTASYLQAVNQYYFNYNNGQAGQENKNGFDQEISLDSQTKPLWGIELDLKGENDLIGATYLLGAQQNRAQRKNDVDGIIKFTTSDGWGPLEKIESSTEYQLTKTRNSQQVTPTNNPNFNLDERRMRQTIRRPLGDKVALQLTGEGDLQQSFYDDGSQDNDVLRLLGECTLGYKPTKLLDTRVTGQYQQRQTVDIPSANSAQSNTEDTYIVGSEVNCPLNPNLSINQKYTITADYSFYNFNENSNGLVRTSEIRTGLDSTVGEKIKLSLKHDYRFKDSGKYATLGPGLPRAYSKATQETYQYLEAQASYAFSEDFDIHSDEFLEVRRTSQVSAKNQPATIARRSQFSAGLGLNHKFSDDFSIQSKVDNYRSNSEPIYWQITASLNRKF